MKLKDCLHLLSAMPRRHESLPDYWRQRADAVYNQIGDCLGITRQKWHEGFLHDAHPDGEIRLWERVTAVFVRLTAGKPDYLRSVAYRACSRSCLHQ